MAVSVLSLQELGMTWHATRLYVCLFSVVKNCVLLLLKIHEPLNDFVARPFYLAQVVAKVAACHHCKLPHKHIVPFMVNGPNYCWGLKLHNSAPCISGEESLSTVYQYLLLFFLHLIQLPQPLGGGIF